MRIVLILLVVLSTVWAQSPQPAPSITGVVVDSSNASVAGATVTLRRMADATQRVATVEPTGTFRFDGVAPGDYEVEIRHEGFQPSVSRVRVGPRSPARLKIVLAVAELRQGGHCRRPNRPGQHRDQPESKRRVHEPEIPRKPAGL
jgi:hypothetical protein